MVVGGFSVVESVGVRGMAGGGENDNGLFKAWRDGICGWSGERDGGWKGGAATWFVFFLFGQVGRAVGLLEKDGFIVRVLFVLPPKCAKLPSLCVC